MHRLLVPWMALLVLLLVACSSHQDMRGRSRADAGEAPSEPEVDIASPMEGVPSRGRDPAVLALAGASPTRCTGTLVGSNALLTAAHCALPCSTEPPSLTVHSAEDVPLARSIEVLLPHACESAIALVVLDRDLPDVTPLPIRKEPAEKGEHLRTVSFATRHGDGTALQLVREHVPMRTLSAATFEMAEASCQRDLGGPALDEGTSEIVGIMTQSSTACDGADAHKIYARIDPHASWLEAALARAKEMRRAAPEATDGGLPRPKTPKKSKPPSDVGEPCQRGTDCATAICAHGAYCSRSCGAGDRCPTGYRCKEARGPNDESEGSTLVKACLSSSS